MRTAALAAARRFLEHRRIALVGLSRNGSDFTRAVFRELTRRGYDVVPVHLSHTYAEGRPCYARLQDIQPPVAGAMLFTPPGETLMVVRDCIAAGVPRVWMHRGMGAGSASPEALTLCKANGIEVVTDLCPFMALPDAGWPHRLHRMLRREALPVAST